MDQTIHIGGLWDSVFLPIVAPIIGTLAMVVVGWLAALASKLFGLKIEGQHRDALQTAIENAAGLALQKFGPAIRGASIRVNNPAITAAADYIIDAVPDALRYFGILPKADATTAQMADARAVLAEKVIAKVGVLSAPAMVDENATVKAMATKLGAAIKAAAPKAAATPAKK